MSQNESIFAIVAIPAALAGGVLAWMFRRLDRLKQPAMQPAKITRCSHCGGASYRVNGKLIHVCAFDRQPWRTKLQGTTFEEKR